MPPNPLRRAPKIFLGAARLKIFLGPASHPPWQNPESAPDTVCGFSIILILKWIMSF